MISGGVKHERLNELVAVLREIQAQGVLPYEGGSDWIELVIASAACANRVNAHLVEGDDAIYGAYRWPPLGA